MAVSRFYYPDTLGAGMRLDLPEHAAHHAARVLRLKAGDIVTLFNGSGGEYEATILRVDKQTVSVKTGPLLERERESSLEVALAQAVSAGDRMDFTVQKAVELGIGAIQPLSSARSVVRLQGERLERRVQHWQNVAIAACEQCGRNRVPEITPIRPLIDWLGEVPREELKLMLSPYAEINLRELPRPTGRVWLLIGPEGGFDEAETKAASVAGFTPVRLGPRVLRTETAALAALAAMQTLWGDF
jgi:16S rRNA (uracil1498-N3)-methyltransferase